MGVTALFVVSITWQNIANKLKSLPRAQLPWRNKTTSVAAYEFVKDLLGIRGEESLFAMVVVTRGLATALPDMGADDVLALGFNSVAGLRSHVPAPLFGKGRAASECLRRRVWERICATFSHAGIFAEVVISMLRASAVRAPATVRASNYTIGRKASRSTEELVRFVFAAFQRMGHGKFPGIPCGCPFPMSCATETKRKGHPAF